ncbi:uncharacterized protein J7T54_000497 [Emericellopsis cladophorae]|uniref:Acyltransferase MbtK/IucB-like conserved domain-containing protein n=1 Tax=Emericellopsis cladophorae TaxID=2686198 RepID=A0A9P9XVY2_9HYPO|nr:uncharacterized protein J7T54_000497 [Emericellopsis cladophorae]KAI6778379.1 hypothetical protein J7T54_000497 [Emericellopsis cladophorae]
MGSIVHEAPLATRVDFKLPDAKTPLWIDVDSSNERPVYNVGQGDSPVTRWVTSATRTRVSPSMVNDDRAEFEELLQFEPVARATARIGANTEDEDIALLWVSVYALWLHPQHRDKDLIAISLDNERLGQYVRCTGLGVTSPYSAGTSTTTITPKENILWLHREAFWQGAGAPDSQSWLQLRPEITLFPGFNGTAGSFASQMGFTRKGNVCTVHPVRPPKPAPGTVVYSRFIVELGQQLQIIHIDASNPLHFQTYARWQNSDRVNLGWKERGPDEHHRKYLASQLADPHTMSCVFAWDGELAGYTEIGFAKEDNVACFVGSNCNIVLGEHDQNSHILVGEEHFRGGKRYQAVSTSIKHCCFLRDPRTKQVVAEPRHDLSNVKIQERFMPQEKKRRFHLPHKTAVLFALQRDRFFQEGHFV